MWTSLMRIPTPWSEKLPPVTGLIEYTLPPTGHRSLSGEAHAAQATVVDVTRGQAAEHIPVGVLPWGLGIIPYGAKAYVTKGFSGTVSILDLSTQTKIKDLEIAGLPVDASVHPQRHLTIVSNKRQGVAHLIDTDRDVGLRDIPIGKEVHGVRFSLNGHAAYVSNTLDN